MPQEPPVQADSQYLSSSQAIQLLHIKRETLYTYVSRGVIRSIVQPGRKARLYYREDVEKVRDRRAARYGHGPVAEAALRLGQPVVSTAITEITPEGPCYRGRLATALAQHPCSFESTAELLWSGISYDEQVVWDADDAPEHFKPLVDGLGLLRPRQPMLRILALTTTLLGTSASDEIRHGTTIALTRRLIRAQAACCGYLSTQPRLFLPQQPMAIAEQIMGALKVKPSDAALRALNTMLILCADHELSSSTFAARIAASTGGGLHACVLAASATHSGSLLGGTCDKTEDLLHDTKTAKEALQRLVDVEREGRRLPGFNMPIYPRGDPRARFLLKLAAQLPANNARGEMVLRLIEDAEHELDMHPSVEAGLIATTAMLGMPERSAGTLWAIARVAGWAAHVMEQRLAGYVLRPRARYISSA
jgi:citrate synthase